MDLYEMSLEELKQLRKDVEKAIETYEARQMAEARAKLEVMAAEMGVKLEDVMGMTGKGKGKSQGVPKYCHPKDPTKTWTGKGRKPGWFIQAVEEEGMNPDDLKI
jgi:DNA-binding protein H-NS